MSNNIANNDKKIRLFVIKLIELTQNGTIQWKRQFSLWKCEYDGSIITASYRQVNVPFISMNYKHVLEGCGYLIEELIREINSNDKQKDKKLNFNSLDDATRVNMINKAVQAALGEHQKNQQSFIEDANEFLKKTKIQEKEKRKAFHKYALDTLAKRKKKK
ncbi:MAG: hypothetical protein HYW78_02315 [Parcubacteria group bacterium]|nr:hypothetical protein [Parcubacteria group bacterium]